jgi:ectoine hydroxylase-related dioxygenase (phytanoyl-CoA dioxygenase family)
VYYKLPIDLSDVRRLDRRVLRRVRPRMRLEAAARRTRRTARFLANRRPRAGDTELMGAVREGDLDRVNQLALEGDGLDTTNRQGQTALHLAAALGRPEIAGCLLAHGADHELRDSRGRTPLSLDVTDITVLHSIRQHYQRFPYPKVRVERADDSAVRHAAAELEASGILRLPGAIDSELLEQLRADFGAFIAELEGKIETGDADYKHYDTECYYWPDDRAYITNNAYKHSAALARLCCSSPFLDIARLYLGKPAYIQRANAMRYLPVETSEHDMFRFHHDLVDKRLKLMVLLTDVGEADQYMSYVVGSHALFHPYEMFRTNVCPTEYCERNLGRLEIFQTLGQAGDVFLFDSNGAHKGNRRPHGRTRDAFFVEFSAASSPQFGGDIPAEVFDDHPLVESNPLYVMANSPKRWERPIDRGSRPSWIVDLPQPSTWIWRAPRNSMV